MKELDSIFVFRMVIICTICCLFNNSLVYLLAFIYMLSFGIKNVLIYLLLILTILLTNSLKIDFIPYGIVEERNNNYYIVDKFFYKEKIISEDLEVGDIIKTIETISLDQDNFLKKNILFECKSFDKIFELKIRKNINERINNSNADITDGLNKFLLNNQNYDNLNNNFGYGLVVYYFIRIISKKSPKIGFILMFIYSICFYFDVKFYLLLIDLIYIKDNSLNKISLKILLISIINIKLFNNFSILIPLLISIYSKSNKTISFNMYLSLIQSFLFGYFDLIKILIFKYLIYYEIFVFVLSLFTLFFPVFISFLKINLNILTYINNLEIKIRGSLTIIGIFLYLLIVKLFKIKNKDIKYLTFILCLLTPFNNPFMQVCFIDVGQGDSILIKLPLSRGNILIDTGSKYNYYNLSKYLNCKGIYNIDYLIITHNDSDHNGNADILKKDFEVKNIIEKPIDISFKGMNLKNIKIDKFDNDNDNSLVYWCNIDGICFLFTGDISYKVEQLIINKYSNIDVDILKVSHHGSKSATSEELLKYTLPKLAIISTSGMYGHPNVDVMNRLNDYMVDSYITSECGNVEIYISKLGNLLKTESNEFAIIMCDDIHN